MAAPRCTDTSAPDPIAAEDDESAASKHADFMTRMTVARDMTAAKFDLNACDDENDSDRNDSPKVSGGDWSLRYCSLLNLGIVAIIEAGNGIVRSAFSCGSVRLVRRVEIVCPS
jgi:hypothetical protein